MSMTLLIFQFTLLSLIAAGEWGNPLQALLTCSQPGSRFKSSAASRRSWCLSPERGRRMQRKGRPYLFMNLLGRSDRGSSSDAEVLFAAVRSYHYYTRLTSPSGVRRGSDTAAMGDSGRRKEGSHGNQYPVLCNSLKQGVCDHKGAVRTTDRGGRKHQVSHYPVGNTGQ